MMRNMIAKIKMPSKNTRTDILNHLLGNNLTALQLKDKLGINESAVRRHLQKLENKNLIEHHFEKASKGRPKKYYKLTEKGLELFPKETSLLLNILIERLEEELSEEEMENLMKKVGDDLEDYLKPEGENEDIETQLQKMLVNFNDLGVFSSYQKDDDGYLIEYRNCIFSDVSKSFARYICGIHKDIMKDVLGEKIDFEQKSSILSGDEICQQKIRKKR